MQVQLVQRCGDHPCPASGCAPTSVRQVLRAPGRPLDPVPRRLLERRFGADLDTVRVHTDSTAAESARDVHAQAYTVGEHIAFAPGRYEPHSAGGLRLLTHELTHVLQQRAGAGSTPQPSTLTVGRPDDPAEAAADHAADAVLAGGTVTSIGPSGAPALRRSIGDDRCSGTNTVCATADACVRPDPGKAGSEVASTRWELEVNIDIERSSWQAALWNQEFGHTHVRLWEDSGREYTFGFYPAGRLPNENVRSVPGCVHHPDTTHDACVDDKAAFTLTQQQFQTALDFAQSICRSGHDYGQSYTCTTYAEEVARAAGQSLPSSRSLPTKVYYQPVPPIDNPNTLIENVRAGRRLTTDTEIRNWVRGQAPAALATVPTAEAIRLIRLLLDGWWISEEDIAAVESICGAVATATQMALIRDAIRPTTDDFRFSFGQRERVRRALDRVP